MADQPQHLHEPSEPAGCACACSTPAKTRRPSPWALAAIVVAVGVGVVPFLAPNNGTVRTFGITFVSIVLEALPFVMLGSLIGGLIEVFLSRERVSALLPRGKTLAVFAAASLGILIPVCECAIIPVTRRLVRKGVPFSVAVAYLIAGPIVNPIVAASTAVAYSGPNGHPVLVVVARLVCGYAAAVFIALMIEEFFPGQRALRADWQAAPNNDACGCGPDSDDHDHGPAPKRPLLRRLVDAGEHGADDFLNVSQFLIIGALVAAASQSFIARQTFLDFAATPVLTIVLMMVLAVALNLCSEADAFVAASFRGTLPLSAQMAFMVLGPMLDLKLIAMYLSFVRKRALLVMVILMCVLVFGMMLTLHYFAWSSL